MGRKLAVFIVMSIIVIGMFVTSWQSVSAVTVTPMVVAGENYTVALKSDGTVWAWGDNSKGQLGDGTATQRNTPVQVSGLSGVTAITAGNSYTVALKSDGTVWTWGYNGYGQLGDGTTVDRNTPVQVSGLSGVTAITAGDYHTVAVKSDGTVWAWGCNGYGQLGDGTTTQRNTPVQVSGLSGVTAITAGYSHTVALKSDGTVWTWGYNSSGQLGDGTTTQRNTPVQVSGLSGVTAITAGYLHTVVLKSDGTVWAWGYNGYGQLGDGTTVDRNTPVQVSGLSGVTAITAGDIHTVAVKSDGTVWAWGDNYYGQLGDGTTTQRNTPVQVSGLSGVTAITAGEKHTVALKSDGTVWAWGYNYYGQLGDGTTTYRNTPVQVSGLSGVTAITAGSSHTVTLKSDGTVWAWGYNYYGQLGDGTTTNRNTPVQVSGLSGVTAITAGYYHTVALKSDGTVWAWGYNYYGQLGDGTTTYYRNTPVQVSGLSGVIAITAGKNHTVALKSDGTVWAWGYNGGGQLGDGTTTNRNTPVQVSGLSGVTVITAGNNHTVALKSDGTVWAWGYNYYGQLGDGTTTQRNTPVQVSGLSGVTAITAGDYHTVALKSDGTVRAWGYNYYGQLGDGTSTNRNTPVQVSGLSGVTAITAGDYHTVALKSDGTVWTWGYNDSGQLGDGTSTNRNTPVQVSGLSGVTAITAGENHTVALKQDTTIQSWGYNFYGQLGIGIFAYSTTQVQVKDLNLVIDTTAPTIALIPSTTAFTNQNVTVTTTLDGTGSNIVTKKWGAGSQTAAYFATGGTDISVNSFVVSANGTYTVYAKDQAGNEATQTINITNIDKEVPMEILISSPATWTNQNVTVDASLYGTGSNIVAKKWAAGNQPVAYFATGGTGISGSNFAVSTNGTYTVYAKDEAGNEAVQIIWITNIDKAVPTVMLISSPTAWTNQNVTVNVTLDGTGSNIVAKKWGAGNQTTAYFATAGTDIPDSNFIVSANGTYTVYAKDKASNETVQTINVTNIDKAVPTVALTPSTTAWTKTDVTVTATFNGTGSSIATKKWVAGSQPVGYFATAGTDIPDSSFVVSTNGTYTVYARDEAGNEVVQTVSVTNIDKAVPTVALTPSTTAWTKSDVTVTTTLDGTGSNVAVKKYASGSQTTAYFATAGTDISGSNFVVSANGTYTVYAKDEAGNEVVQTISVTNIDKAVPTVALTPSTTAWTKSDVTVTTTLDGTGSNVAVKKWVTGSQTTAYFATGGTDIAGINFVVSSNGTYTVYAKDEAGNEVVQTISVTNIDKAIPTALLNPSTTAWTKTDVTVTTTLNGTGSSIAVRKWATGNQTTGYFATAGTDISGTNFVVSSNGTYTVYAKDEAGNEVVQTVSVTNIDKAVPTAVLTPSTTAWTKSDVTVTTTLDGTGSNIATKKYATGSQTTAYFATAGTDIAGTNFVVSTNGTYTVYAKDEAGNEVVQTLSITNIDKTVPTVALVPSTTAWTKTDVTVTTTLNGTGSNIVTKKYASGSQTVAYFATGGTDISGSSIIVSANGTYTVYAKDEAGNEVVQTISVANIDKTVPTVALVPSTTAWTKTDVTVTTTLDGTGSNIVTRKWVAGNQTLAYFATGGAAISGSSFVVSANGTYTVYAKDEAGNEAMQTVTIVNIDKAVPTVALTPSTLAWTSQNVTVTVMMDGTGSNIVTKKYATGSQTVAYFATGGTDISGTNFVVSANGTYTVYAKDEAGNEVVQTLSVTNIDKAVPTAVLTPSTTAWTKSDVTVTTTLDGTGSNVAVKKYATGSQTTVYFATAGTDISGNSFTVSANGTYTVYAKDEAGNEVVQTLSITNIDKTVPTVALVPSTTAWTKTDVTVTTTLDGTGSNIVTKKYATGSQTVAYFATGGTDISGSSFVVSANGTYTVYAKDEAGNEAVQTINVTNIDETVPTVALTPSTTAWTKTDVTVTTTLDGTGSNIAVKKWATGSQTTTYFATGGIDISGSSIIVSANGTYTVYAKDEAGNEAVQTINVTNIDKALPTVGLIPSTTAWTKTDVTVTTTLDGTGSNIVTKKYATGNQTTAYFATAGTDISGSNFVVSANGTYTVYAKDEAGNEVVQTISVTNIDKAVPTVALTPSTTAWTKSDVTVTTTLDGTGSNVAVKKYATGSQTVAYFATGGTDISGINFVVSANGTYTVYAKDEAGNEVVQTISVTNIDKAVPTVALTPSTTAWTKSDVTVTNTLDGTGSNVAVKKWVTGSQTTAYFATGGTDISGNSFTVSANGTYTVYAKDEAGNEVVQTLSITNIDKTVPTVALVPSTTAWTKTDVTVTTTLNGTGSNIVTKKYASGSQTVAYFATGGTDILGSSIIVSANGTYTVYAKDEAGNEAVQTINVTNIDKALPTVGLIPSTTAWTKTDVTVTTTLDGTGSNIVTKKYAAGSQTTAYFATGGTDISGSSFIVSANGTYTVYAKDEAGNEAVQTINVTNIDKTAPTQPTISTETNWTNASNVPVTITVGTDDASGVNRVEYSLSGATTQDWTTYTGIFNVVNEGQTTITSRNIDNAGNISDSSTTTIKIDRTPPTTPQLTADITTPTLVSIIVTASNWGDASTKQYRINGEAWNDYTMPIIMAQNGLIEVRGIDEVGNISGIGSINITNIVSGAVVASSAEVPELSADKAIDGDEATRWSSATNDSEWIYIDLGEVENIRRVVLNWESYAKEYQIQISNDARTWTTVYSTINGDGGIDDIFGLTASGRFVKMQGIKRGTSYGYGLYEFKVYTGTEPMAIASSVEAPELSPDKAIDGDETTRWSSAYNDSEWICIDLGKIENIRSLALKWESYAKEYQIQVSNDAHTWTTVYSTTNGDGGIDDIFGLTASGRFVKMQGIKRGTPYGYGLYEFKAYTGTEPMAIASSVEAPELSPDKAIDGNETTRWSSAYNDSEWICIDLRKTESIRRVVLNWESYAQEYQIQVSNNASTWTTVYSTVAGDGGIDDIAGLTASGRFVRMQGIKRGTPYGYGLYEFKVYTGTESIAIASSVEAAELSADKAIDGNEITRWSSAYNDAEWIYIDLGRAKDINRVVLKWEAHALEYQIQVSDNANTWTTVYNTTTGDGGVDDISGLTTTGRYVKMQGIKRATPYGYGLYEFEVYATDTDQTAPTIELTPSTAAWTREDVTVTATLDGTGSNIVVKCWSAGDQTVEYFAIGGIDILGDSFAVSTNGTYTVYAKDEAENEVVQTITINNIDKTAPTQPTILTETNWTNASSVPVTVTGGTDNVSGVNRIEYSLSGATTQDWTAYAGAFEVVNEGQTTIVVRSIDNAGNISDSSTATVKIDRNLPTTPELVADITIPTIAGVTVTISNWGDASTKQYRVNGEAWNDYTMPIVMTQNGLIEARGTDEAGNISGIGSINITNIVYGSAIASSAEAPELSADKAVDGDETTRWASAYNDSEWIYIDLGKVENIRRVVLNWESYAKEYQIQISNDSSTWTTVYSTTNGDGGIDDIFGLTGSGRFVKMQGIKRGTPYGYALYEFKVYTGTEPMAMASSIETPQLSADKAIDGDETTRWSSAYNDSEWICIDLGQTGNIRRVVLSWESYAQEYQIQVSDDAITWTTVYSTTNGDGGIDDIFGLVASGRFVKMQGVKRGTPYGYGLYEFKVHTGTEPMAVASSVEAPQLSADKAIDGDETTRWSSAYNDSEWICIDLGQTENIRRVVLNWESYAKEYQIQVSNDFSTWTTIYSTASGNGGTDDIFGLVASGRFIKMQGVKRGTTYGYVLYEFKVYTGTEPMAVASSVESSELSADNAIDGNETTRWASAYSDSEWICIDLGVTKNITHVVLNWEAAYALEYQIQVSDDANTWTTVYSTTTGDGEEDDISGLSVSGRFIKMQGVRRATSYGYALYEFKVYTN